MRIASRRLRRQSGFSLVEMLVVVAILVTVMGVVFQQINEVQKRARSEENKLDMMQQSRETLDQMVRDLHQAGYPNRTMYAGGVLGATPKTHTFNAVGLVKITNNPPEIIFEGDVDSDHQVDSVRYRLVTTSAESTHCPCVERSQVVKVTGEPLTGQSFAYHVSIENVASSGLSFTAYDLFGNTVTIPSGGLDINGSPTTLSSIRSIQITLQVQGQTPDLSTRRFPATAMTVNAQLRNQR